MRLTRKAVSALAIAVAGTVILLVFSLNRLIDKNHGRVRDEIQKTIGRNVTFDRLELSLWGGPGLSARELRVKEDPRFAATPFIQSQELKMRVRLLALLFGRIVVDKLILYNPEIQIIRNEEGMLNLTALARQKQAQQTDGAGKVLKTEADGSKTARMGLEFLVSKIDVRNGKIEYIDRSFKEPVEMSVRKADLEFEGLPLSGAARVKVAANLFNGQMQNIFADGKIGPWENGQDWSAQPLELNLQIKSLVVPQLTRAVPFLREKIPDLGITGPVNLQAKLAGHLDRPRIHEMTLTGAFFGASENNTTIRGDADFSNGDSWSDGEFRGTIAVDPVQIPQLLNILSVRQSLPLSLTGKGPLSINGKFQGNSNNFTISTVVKAEQAEIHYRDWLNKTAGVPAELELNLERQQDRFAFRDSALRLHNVKLRFSGSFEDLPERRLALTLHSDAVGLGGWDKLLVPLSLYSIDGKIDWALSIKKQWGLREPTLEIRGTIKVDQASFKSKKSGRGIDQVKAEIVFNGNQARIENSSLRVASSELAVEGVVPDLLQPSLRFTARSSALRMGDLIEQSTSKTDELKNLIGTGELNLTNGKPILLGHFSSGEGTLQKIHYRNLLAEVAWAPKSLSFKNLSFQALNGIFRASGSWNAAESPSQRIDLASQIDAMDLKALLAQKFPRFKDHIEGRLDFNARLHGESRNGSGLQESLTGDGATQIQGGTLKDFNVLGKVLAKVGGLPGVSDLLTAQLSPRYSALLKRPDTPFETLRASFTVEKERIRTDRLVLATPEYTVNGEGWIGFDKTTHWNAVLILSPGFTKDLMQEHRNVRYLVDPQGRFAVPFRLEGTLPNVQAQPDMRAMAETLQRRLLKKGLERSPGREKLQKKKEPRGANQKGPEPALRK